MPRYHCPVCAYTNEAAEPAAIVCGQCGYGSRPGAAPSLAPPGTPAVPRTHQAPVAFDAILSLILGILAIPVMGGSQVALGIGLGVSAVVLGMLALSKTTGPTAAYSGRGMAIAGIITACLAIGLPFAVMWS